VISADDASLSWAADDFGHFIHARPAGVLRPDSVSEIQAVLGEGRALRARGEGHSTAGQAQQAGGVVVDMRRLNSVHEVTSAHVLADAGARWSSVVAATLPFGLTPPVLTDYLELSVGGTISAGGIGGMTHQYGLQADNVAELEVLRPDGVIQICRAGDPLFDLVRGGYGNHGIILRARLRLVPAHSQVWRYKLLYRSLPGFLADQRMLMADRRFSYLEGQAEPDGTFELEAVSYGAPGCLHGLSHAAVDSVEVLPYFDFLNRLAAGEARWRADGDWDRPHPWLNLFLPGTAIDSFMAELTSSGPELGANGTVLVYPFDTSMITAPQVPLPSCRVAFLVALLRIAPDQAALNRMLADNNRLRQRTLEVGGTVYLDVSHRPGGGTQWL
jgi:cytokinin dehydrogenase